MDLATINTVDGLMQRGALDEALKVAEEGIERIGSQANTNEL
jgi:hypothetical protein